MEVFLQLDERFRLFFDGEAYENWEPGEAGGNQLAEPQGDDDEAQLANRRRDLKLFLSLIAKTLPKSKYSTVMNHSTSLEWIYDMIREDYDIQKRGIHILNIIDLKFDKDTMKPVAFYNQYRAMLVNNLAQRGDVVKYKQRKGQPEVALQANETIGACFEDTILINVLTNIDHRLPGYIKKAYAHKLGTTLRLMDFKTDILVNIPKFLEELEEKEQLMALKVESSSLGAFRTGDRGAAKGNYRGGAGAFATRGYQTPPGSFGRGFGRGGQPASRATFNQGPKSKKPFCWSCWDKDKGRSVYNSHNIGDKSCPTGSHLGNVAAEEEPEQDDSHQPQSWELGEEEAHPDHLPPALQQVPTMHKVQNLTRPPDNFDLEGSCSCIRCQQQVFTLGRIKAEPTQILTVFVDKSNNNPIHIDLDSGANVGFISLEAVKKWNFKMEKCSQLSKLGDGYTTLPSIGEIHEVFYRNGWSVVFRALVVEKLHSDLVGGTTFLKDNAIIQDFTRSTISIHDKKHTVMDTKKEATLSTAPKPEIKKPLVQQLKQMQVGLRTLLPGQTLHQPVDMEDGEIVLVQGHNNNTCDWPEAQLCTVSQGKVEVSNDTEEPILLGKKGQVKTLKILQTHEETSIPEKLADSSYYDFNKVITKATSGGDNINKITFGPSIEEGIRQQIHAAHIQHQAVFDDSLTGGYNHYYGHHECKLNWASQARPQSNKRRAVNYSHELNGLLQEVIDDLTREKVLRDPQDPDLNISVQCICPAFLTRKQKAKDKPKHLLTKEDVRLLVNFGPVNEFIKNVPAPMTTVDEVFNTMGKFKHIIVFDLHSGFFQNHMSSDSLPWLGLASPFGGLRVITRSAQGLLGMSEEFSLLLRKILKEELQQGKCCQLVDDIIVGGNTQQEAADNYLLILQKLALANLKVSAAKTHIFPEQADILGWVWRKGGKLEPSPHRRNALVNTKKEDIVTTKDMRSFVGLYKTLRRASPNMAQLMEPLEKAVANKESRDPFPWTHEMEMRFKEAQADVENMHTLYLPSPSDKLALIPDAARVKPGIGHVLYAIKDNRKVPVRFHSVKLPDKCDKWQPCEVEALAFATGIEAEYDLIRENKHPLLVCPDSKVVADAVALIKQGKFSSSPRINKFITNVNKIPLEVAHVSGKAKLNEGADYQSRSPSTCNSDLCSICNFVKENIEGVIDPAAKNAAVAVVPLISMGNRQAWRKAQNQDPECKAAFSHIKSGKTPSAKAGDETLVTLRRYCREATIAKDNVLVVKEQAKASTGWLARERIVVPQKLLPTLLYEIHHNNDNHPTKTQMKLQFERSFYAIEVDKNIELLYKNCYNCSLLQRLPKVEIKEESKAEVAHPHQYFHLDVIRRAKQFILLLVDHFSNFQTAKLIPSEKAEDLKEGLIVLSEGMRHPGPITVKGDNAKGLESLQKKDQDLAKLNINLILADVFNKNSNAVIDKACQELEEELRKLSPEGSPISQATLAQALIQVNKKIRRQGKLSAYEIHAARDAVTGENLHLDDPSIRTEHLRIRETSRKPVTAQPPSVQVGDTVVMNKPQDKHKAREAFVVTEVDKEHLQAQKLIHPLLPGKAKMMSKVYKTNPKHVTVVHKTNPLHTSSPKPPSTSNPLAITPTKEYDPVNSRFWEDSTSDSDEELPNQAQRPIEIPLVSDEGASHEENVNDDTDNSSTSHTESIDRNDEINSPEHFNDPDQQAEVANTDEESGSEHDGEADVEDNVEEEEDRIDEQNLPPLDQGQGRKLKKGDVISYGIELTTEHERWAEAVIVSASRTPHYYNIKRLDTHEKLGIYLLPDTAWHLGFRLECERQPLLHPNSRETSPILLRREEREFRFEFELDHLGEPLLLAEEDNESRL